jgi:hypothetical protein
MASTHPIKSSTQSTATKFAEVTEPLIQQSPIHNRRQNPTRWWHYSSNKVLYTIAVAIHLHQHGTIVFGFIKCILYKPLIYIHNWLSSVRVFFEKWTKQKNVSRTVNTYSPSSIVISCPNSKSFSRRKLDPKKVRVQWQLKECLKVLLNETPVSKSIIGPILLLLP